MSSLTEGKGAMRSRGAIGAAVVILAMLAKLFWGVELDAGLQAAIVDHAAAWLALIAGTVALIGRLRAAVRITKLW